MATPVREPEELVTATGSDTLAYSIPMGRSERPPPQLQRRAEEEIRMRSFFMIGFQLIILAGLLLMGDSVQRHATADAQRRRPAFADSGFGIRIGIPVSSLSSNCLEENC